MLKNIKISNYRGIKNIQMNDFSNVNIFVGKANTGKTSILEAIFILLNQTPVSAQLISDFRRMIANSDIFDSMFYDYDTDAILSFSGNIDDKHTSLEIKKANQKIISYIDQGGQNIIAENIKRLEFSLKNSNKEFNKQFLEIQHQKEQGLISFNIQADSRIQNNNVDFIANFGSVKFKNNLNTINNNVEMYEKFEKYFKEFDKKITKITFGLSNEINIGIKGLKHSVNFKTMGKGFQSYINIITSMISGNNTIIIDEIENGIHFEIMETLIKNIFHLSKTKNLQFFITTHSEELLKYISKIAKNTNFSNCNIYNIFENKNQQIEAIKYDTNSLISSIETQSEIRD